MYLGGPENSKVSVVEINCTKASMTESIKKYPVLPFNIIHKKDIYDFLSKESFTN